MFIKIIQFFKRIQLYFYAILFLHKSHRQSIIFTGAYTGAFPLIKRSNNRFKFFLFISILLGFFSQLISNKTNSIIIFFILFLFNFGFYYNSKYYQNHCFLYIPAVSKKMTILYSPESPPFVINLYSLFRSKFIFSSSL